MDTDTPNYTKGMFFQLFRCSPLTQGDALSPSKCLNDLRGCS